MSGATNGGMPDSLLAMILALVFAALLFGGLFVVMLLQLSRFA